ncbi:MAG: hypothetical protein JNK35_05945 [Phycisphaerae bacterium]|nr:hypothetical protein [Phycisphaerae bacterium]
MTNPLRSGPGDQQRGLYAEAIIALALCAGLSLGIVEPLERRLHEAEARLEALRSREAEAARGIDAREASAAIQTARDFAARVAQASALAVDEGSLMERVSALAGGAGVRLDEMQPARSVETRGGGAKPLPAGEHRAAYSFRLVGGYRETAALLAALTRDAGFAVVRSVRLTPILEPGSRDLQVTIESEHFAFPGATAGAATAPGGPRAVSASGPAGSAEALP